MAEINSFIINGVSVPIVQELSLRLFQQTSDDDHDTDAAAQFSRFIRPENERLQQSPAQEQLLPVIDMSRLLGSYQCPNEMQKLHKACQEWGFFQVVNHGIPASLLDRTRGVARDFFQLPLQEKLKYAHRPGSYEGYGQASVFSEDQTLDWSDNYSITLLPEQMRNLEMWPQSPPDFRETMDGYTCEVEKLGLRLLQLFAQNLGLTSETRLADLFKRGTLTSKLNYYPPCPRPDCALGFSPHSDTGFLTILLQDDETVGLHILRTHQNWLPVEPIPGALVVNVGDSLEVITNGRYKSVEHCAVTNKSSCRISIAAFCNPGHEEVVGPIPELINQQCPAAYRTFRRADFANYFISGKLQGKKRAEEFIKIAHKDQ